jgi:hypothetical protein
MFRFYRTIITPNTVHSISTFSKCMYALNECTNTVYCIFLYDGSIELKHVAKFLILITDICCVVD